jgi:hypothetical protein
MTSKIQSTRSLKKLQQGRPRVHSVEMLDATLTDGMR